MSFDNTMPYYRFVPKTLFLSSLDRKKNIKDWLNHKNMFDDTNFMCVKKRKGPSRIRMSIKNRDLLSNTPANT